MYVFLCARIRCLTFAFSKRRSAHRWAGTQNAFYTCIGIGGSSDDDIEAAVGMVPQLNYIISFQIFSK